MRSFFRPLLLAVGILLGTFPLFASPVSDELAVIRVALDQHFEKTLPYVNRWVVAEKTEPLEAGDFDLGNATCRTGEPLDMAPIKLRDGVEFAALEKFASEGTFDWGAFEQAFGEAWTARVDRPCFIDGANAVVRVDVSASQKQRSLRSAIRVTKGADGVWVVKAGSSR